LEEGTEGVAAMGELPLLISGEFGHGEAKGGEKEEGIVTEAVGAARGGEELAFHGSGGVEEGLAVVGEDEGTYEAGCAVGAGKFVEFSEEGAVVALVFGAVAGLEGEVVGEAGAAYAGTVVEGGELDAGVVAEDEVAGSEAGVSDGFEFGVAEEGGGVFDRLGHGGDAGKGEDGEAGGLGGGGELGELAGVGGGGVEGHRHRKGRTSFVQRRARRMFAKRGIASGRG
jgi:hypothetical protein